MPDTSQRKVGFWWLLALTMLLVLAMWALSPRFYAPGMHPLLGRSLLLRDVRVAEVNSDQAFWGSAGGKVVLVVLDGRTRGTPLKAGRNIGVIGTVHAMPEWPEARSRWALKERVRDRVEQQRLYVAAKEVN